MPTIPVPLPETIRGSKVVPKQGEYLVNLMNLGGYLVSRPAFALERAISGSPRGMWEFNGKLYYVKGTTLYEGLGGSVVGSIAGTLPVNIAIGFTQCAIASGAGNYVLSTSGTLTQVTDPDLPPCVDVTRINGRFVWVPTDGGVLRYSDVNDASVIDTLSFFDAETRADQNIGVVTVKNDLIVFGEQSTERFRDIGPAESPFIRVNNAIVDVGQVGGKVKTKDSVVFVGRDANNGYAFFLFSGGSAQIISPTPVNEALNLDYTPAELAAITVQRFHWRGADCYVFRAHDKAWLFQGGKWSYVDSGIDHPHYIGAFDQDHATLFNGEWYLLDNAGLVKMTTGNSDYSGDFSRRVRTFMRLPDETTLPVNYFELVASQGLSGSGGTVGFSVSKNGQTWSNFDYRDLGDVGNYSRRVKYQRVGGLGRFDGYMGITVQSTSDVEFAVDNMTVTL